MDTYTLRITEAPDNHRALGGTSPVEGDVFFAGYFTSGGYRKPRFTSDAAQAKTWKRAETASDHAQSLRSRGYSVEVLG